MGSRARVICMCALPCARSRGLQVTWYSWIQSFHYNFGPKRAPVSGGKESTEGGRETNIAQLTDYFEPQHTKYSQDVRGKAKGKI